MLMLQTSLYTAKRKHHVSDMKKMMKTTSSYEPQRRQKDILSRWHQKTTKQQQRWLELVGSNFKNDCCIFKMSLKVGQKVYLTVKCWRKRKGLFGKQLQHRILLFVPESWQSASWFHCLIQISNIILLIYRPCKSHLMEMAFYMPPEINKRQCPLGPSSRETSKFATSSITKFVLAFKFIVAGKMCTHSAS